MTTAQRQSRSFVLAFPLGSYSEPELLSSPIQQQMPRVTIQLQPNRSLFWKAQLFHRPSRPRRPRATTASATKGPGRPAPDSGGPVARRSWAAPPPSRWRSAAAAGSSRPPNQPPWPSATAAGCSPAATAPWPDARPTTCATGSMAAPPTWRTWPWWAGPTTGRSTRRLVTRPRPDGRLTATPPTTSRRPTTCSRLSRQAGDLPLACYRWPATADPPSRGRGRGDNGGMLQLTSRLACRPRDPTHVPSRRLEP